MLFSGLSFMHFLLLVYILYIFYSYGENVIVHVHNIFQSIPLKG